MSSSDRVTEDTAGGSTLECSCHVHIYREKYPFFYNQKLSPICLKKTAPKIANFSWKRQLRSPIFSKVAILQSAASSKVDFVAGFSRNRNSCPEVFIKKGVLKICSKFTGEHPCRSAISIKLQSNFIEITFRHRCSPVNLLYIFRSPFPKNTSRRLLLKKVWQALLKQHFLKNAIWGLSL